MLKLIMEIDKTYHEIFTLDLNQVSIFGNCMAGDIGDFLFENGCVEKLSRVYFEKIIDFYNNEWHLPNRNEEFFKAFGFDFEKLPEHLQFPAKYYERRARPPMLGFHETFSDTNGHYYKYIYEKYYNLMRFIIPNYQNTGLLKASVNGIEINENIFIYGFVMASNALLHNMIEHYNTPRQFIELKAPSMLDLFIRNINTELLMKSQRWNFPLNGENERIVWNMLNTFRKNHHNDIKNENEKIAS